MIEAVIYAPRAEQDLDDAVAWYESQAEGLGGRFIDFLEQFIANIQNHPELYPTAGHGCRRAPLREFPYEVFYEPTPEVLFVHCVFHTSKNPSLWRQRLRRLR